MLFAAVAAGSILANTTAHAAEFTYHGSLQESGKPAEGRYDIELTLYSAPSGGSVLGGPLTVYAVPVHDGSFSTDVDFGPLAKAASATYVGVRVRSAGAGDYAALDARSAVPEANTGCPGSWSLDGNAGNLVGSYIGTADSQDLDIRAGGGTRIKALAATNAVGMSGGIMDATSGNYSTAVSQAYPAAGAHSFAGGFSAGTLYDGSFVWGDHPSTAHKITDSGPNQFIVQARGGVAINGVPRDLGTMLSIYPYQGDPYVTEYLGQSDFNTGIVLNYGGAQSSSDIALMSIAQSNASGSNPLLDIGDTKSTLIVHPAHAAATNDLGSIRLLDEPQGNWITLSGYGINGNFNLQPGFTIGSYNGDTEQNHTYATFAYKGVSLNNGLLTSSKAIAVGSDTTDGNGAYLSTGGVWTSASSRTFKEDFMHVDVTNVLDKLIAMPVQTWFYKQDHEEGRHMGPVAEDFAQAFGLGNDEKHIGSIDENGVAFAAIQGLNQKVEAENATLRAQNAALRETLDEVLARLGKLETRKEH